MSHFWQRLGSFDVQSADRYHIRWQRFSPIDFWMRIDQCDLSKTLQTTSRWIIRSKNLCRNTIDRWQCVEFTIAAREKYFYNKFQASPPIHHSQCFHSIENHIPKSLIECHVFVVCGRMVWPIAVLVLSAIYTSGVWWIVERAETNQRRIVEAMQEAQQTRPNRVIIENQIEMEIAGIVQQRFEPLVADEHTALFH